MPRVRASLTAFLLVLVFAFLGSPGTSAGEFGAPGLHGIVTDTLGRALEKVEILVLGEASAGAPLAVAHTDGRGRFLVAGLAPGTYRVAAIKQGYLAFFGRFDTLFRDSLDLVLRPVPGADGGVPDAPADASWALRLPARSLLRETGAEDLLRADGSRAPRGVAAAIAEMIQGRLDHLVDLGLSLPGGSRDTTDSGGAETRMRLAGAIGERASVRVLGERESFDRAAASGGSAETASRDASSLLVEATCATGPAAQLAMKASYAQGGLDILPEEPRQGWGVHHARRSWGYDANWSTQLDQASHLAVKVGYLDTLASLPGSAFPAEVLAAADGRRSFASRAMAAGGSYESVAARRHQVRVDLDASFQDLPLPRAEEEVRLSPGLASPAAWSVRVRAEDQWQMSAPLSLVYGLGYARGSDARRDSVIEPRVGAAWTDGTWRSRLVVLFAADVASGTGAGVPAGRNSRRDPALGYEAEVEAPLPWGFSVKAERSVDPVAFDAAGALWERIDPGFTALFVADGSVSARRQSLTLSHESGGVRASAEWIRGSADGTIAQIFPFEVPLQLLADRTLTYRGGSVGVRVATSGTDLRAEYRRVEDTAWAETSAERTTQEFVELQVAQDLFRGDARGTSWRLLLAARTSPQRPTAEASPSGSAAGVRSLAALSRRVSAGVSVVF